MRLAACIAAVAARASALQNPMKDSAKGTPLNVGFFTESLDPFYIWDNETQTRVASGFLRIDEMLLDLMGFDYTYVPLGDTSNGEEKVFGAFSRGEIDVIFAYGTFFVGSPFHVTEPLINMENRAMVKKERRKRDDLSSIFGPFAPRLWYTIAGAIVFVALVLWLLDRLLRAGAYATWDADDAKHAVPFDDGKERAYLYHAASMVLGNDEAGDHVRASPATLLFRVTCLFCGVVLSATYTANLAAFLTYHEFKVVGPQTLAELRASRACIATAPGTYDVWAGNIVRSTHAWPPDIAGGDTPQICQDLLDAGEVDVSVERQRSCLFVKSRPGKFTANRSCRSW